MARFLFRDALLLVKRSTMNKALVCRSLLCIFFFNATCSSANEVRVYNWSDYIDYSVIDDFETSTGVNVIYDVFDSNEVLEGKLLAGNTGYDIVGPSIEYLGRQVMAGVHQKLNKDNIPNLRHLEPGMMELLGTLDPGNNFSMRYLWGTTGIGYNKDQAKKIMGESFRMDSFDVIFKPEIIKQF